MTLTNELLPAARDARDRVAARLLHRQEPSGAIGDRCASRILESALFLRLLELEDVRPDVRARLVDYLEHAERAHFLDVHLARAALGRPGRPGDVLGYLEDFWHFTGERKRLMLTTVLWLAGAIPLTPTPTRTRIDGHGHATWTEVSLRAIRILHADALGEDDDGTDDDREFLVQRLRGFEAGTVWQGNVLAHLVALHALRTYHPGSRLLEDGIGAVAEQLNDDGGVPFINGQDIWVTALAGTALAGATFTPEPLSRMADFLIGHQLPDGGWGYEATTTQADVDDTSRCVDFLHRVDSAGFRDELDRARSYLTAIAGPDGGFPTYLPGHAPEVDLTAGATIALAPAGDPCSALLRAALKFLLAAQYDDGTFDRSWTRSESSVASHVLDAMAAARPVLPAFAPDIDRATSAALGRLRASQNADGGWGHRPGHPSDVISTAHAVSGLARYGDIDDAAGGVEHLIRHQRVDGGYSAVPDQVGPRPIPYDFPALAEIHVLSTLNRVTD